MERTGGRTCWRTWLQQLCWSQEMRDLAGVDKDRARRPETVRVWGPDEAGGALSVGSPAAQSGTRSHGHTALPLPASRGSVLPPQGRWSRQLPASWRSLISPPVACLCPFRYPNTACELLTCDVPQINDRLGGDETLLNLLYDFLDHEPPLNPLLASFFSKTIGNLIARKTEQVKSATPTWFGVAGMADADTPCCPPSL